MKTLSRWLLALLVLGVLAVPVTVEAQRRGDAPPDREQIEQRIRAQMGRMMQQRLGLDQAEAEALSEVVGTFDARRRDIMEREMETRRRVGALQDGAVNEAEARELLELQAELRLQEAELFREEQEALLEVLMPSQVLELQDLRQDIGRRIRALRGGGRPDPDRRRGPGPDGRIGAERRTPPGPPPLG